MGYDYYCTECGKKNNAKNVLFDMGTLLSQDKNKKLKKIQFRLTQAELKELIKTGTPVSGDRGFVKCVMTFGKLMEYLSSPNSMNIPELKDLTLDNIKVFVDKFDLVKIDSSREDSHSGKTLMEGLNTKKEEIEEDEIKSIDPEELPLFINKILDLVDERNDRSGNKKDISMDIADLIADFKILEGLFFQNDASTWEVILKEHTDSDDKGNNFVDGYWANLNTVVNDSRVCSRCHKCCPAN